MSPSLVTVSKLEELEICAGNPLLQALGTMSLVKGLSLVGTLETQSGVFQEPLTSVEIKLPGREASVPG